MKYLLDTNILSYLEEPTSPFHAPVRERFSQLADDDEVVISILTVYELHYSIAAAEPSNPRWRQLLEAFIKRFPVLPLTQQGAEVFGRLKTRHRSATGAKQKTLDQHNIDFILASAALAEGAILVSNDRIFQHIQHIDPAFQLENWALSS